MPGRVHSLTHGPQVSSHAAHEALQWRKKAHRAQRFQTRIWPSGRNIEESPRTLTSLPNLFVALTGNNFSRLVGADHTISMRTVAPEHPEAPKNSLLPPRGRQPCQQNILKMLACPVGLSVGFTAPTITDRPEPNYYGNSLAHEPECL